MTNIRAKFLVNLIKPNDGSDGVTVYANAAASGSEENKSFSKLYSKWESHANYYKS
jgi:hypothetical protein